MNTGNSLKKGHETAVLPGYLKTLAGTMRLPFLLLTPSVMLLGLATAFWENGGRVNLADFLIALLAGTAAHVSVNALNEYSDFKTGLDSHTKRTPFSGGSGALQERPELSWIALATGIAGALVVAGAGIYFISREGWQLLPLLAAGLLVVTAYTPLLTHAPMACLVAPGLGFGTILVTGTHFVLTGHYSMSALWASLVPFFLVNDLLLLNQFPDVEADKKVGRRHFPLAIGRRKSAEIYVFQLMLAYLAIAGGIILGLFPWQCVLGLLTLPLAVKAAKGARQHADDMKNLVPVLGKNVLINLLTPVLVAAGMALAVLF